jgi:hypothetical protein
MTFDEMIEDAVLTLRDLQKRLNADPLSDDAKASVLRGFLLSLGGYSPHDDLDGEDL